MLILISGREHMLTQPLNKWWACLGIMGIPCCLSKLLHRHKGQQHHYLHYCHPVLFIWIMFVFKSSLRALILNSSGLCWLCHQAYMALQHQRSQLPRKSLDITVVPSLSWIPPNNDESVLVRTLLISCWRAGCLTLLSANTFV